MKLRHLILVLVLVLVFFCSGTVHAQEIKEVPYGVVKIVYTPSPDSRAVGHILYFKHVEENKEYWIVAEQEGSYEVLANGDHLITIEAGVLWPNSTYVFTATAFDKDRNQSVHSEALTLRIPTVKAPVDNLLPEIYTLMPTIPKLDVVTQ